MSEMIRCKVIKVFNNNVILVRRVNGGQEEVFVGRGIGFGKKPGQELELQPAEIEKSYITYDRKFKNEYFNLINDLDGEIVGICEEIISFAEKELGSLNQHIHIALTDHISFAIERLSSGLVIDNPFLKEIKVVYNEEYKVAVKAVEIINQRLGVSLPEAEVGFITMHLHAARENSNIKNTLRDISLINRLVEMVEEELEIELQPGELDYIRLLNHLHLSVERVKENKKLSNPLLDRIIAEFNEAYQLAGKLNGVIKEELGLEVDEAEQGYMAIHLQRLKEIKGE
ncbi:MAG: PRD domain-containing protein [Halanaerobium sp.]|nr:PRD domain-containing protein [Halanaerobium sp.]